MTTETTLFYIALVGIVLATIGFFWLVVKAFRVKLAWGLAVLIFPPLGLVFAFRNRKPSIGPIALMFAGSVVAAAPIVFNRAVPIDLGERVEIVDGEKHITLTGWDRRDYSALKAHPDVVVLQMANPDVTDGTLDEVRGLTRLRVLDIGGSQVTDAGLAKLGTLTSLESLYLTDTKVTEDGFSRLILPRENLMQLDLTGTKVSRQAGKAWKAAKPKRKLTQ